MGYKSLINSPTSRDKFRLTEGKDSLYSPGTLEPDGQALDARIVEIQDAQQPGFAGSVAIQKLEKIWTGTYKYKIWTTADSTEDKRFVAILRAGMKKGASPTGPLGRGRRARVWRLSDPRLDGLDISFVTVESIGPQVWKKAGVYTGEIKLHEWKKPIQLPLLKVEPTAADTEVDRRTKLEEEERKANEAQLKELQNAKPVSISDLLPKFLQP